MGWEYELTTELVERILRPMGIDFWKIDGRALQLIREDETGQLFVKFVNDLLNAQAFYSRLPPSTTQLNLQQNLHDGGIDALVTATVVDEAAWMESPTVWQYKRSRPSDTGLKKEINKPTVRKHIEDGFA